MAKEQLLKNDPKPEAPVEKKPNRDELLKAQQEEAQARANACQVDLEALLKKHNCALGAVPELVHAGNNQFTLRAKPVIIPQ